MCLLYVVKRGYKKQALQGDLGLREGAGNEDIKDVY